MLVKKYNVFTVHMVRSYAVCTDKSDIVSKNINCIWPVLGMQFLYILR